MPDKSQKAANEELKRYDHHCKISVALQLREDYSLLPLGSINVMCLEQPAVLKHKV